MLNTDIMRIKTILFTKRFQRFFSHVHNDSDDDPRYILGFGSKLEAPLIRGYINTGKQNNVLPRLCTLENLSFHFNVSSRFKPSAPIRSICANALFSTSRTEVSDSVNRMS